MGTSTAYKQVHQVLALQENVAPGELLCRKMPAEKFFLNCKELLPTDNAQTITTVIANS